MGFNVPKEMEDDGSSSVQQKTKAKAYGNAQLPVHFAQVH
jgi:hypothetical protein